MQSSRSQASKHALSPSEEAPNGGVAPEAARSVSPRHPTAEPEAATASVGGGFDGLGLAPSFVRAVAAEGYAAPTPIQAQAIPHVLAGRDLLACAQTGTGKTAAFLLPLLQRLTQRPSSGRIRALIVTPTRELASQIAERASVYGAGTRLRQTVVFGGVGQKPQEDALRRGVDVLVATPGRLLDLMGQGFARLGAVEVLVLDEADRMLDMGFVHDVKRIVAALPRERQTLLFSATMPTEILSLAGGILRDAVRVSVTPMVTTAERIGQTLYLVSREEKQPLLERLLRGPGVERSIVFTRTKHGANRVAERLVRAGIEAAAIHGNKSQSARERALDGFRRGLIPVLIATDIAARGIDVDGITHVFNFDLPNVAESYVHRIGRTARAGASGCAISFCEPAERGELVAIERFIRARIPLAQGTEGAARGARSAPAPDGARGSGGSAPRAGSADSAPRAGSPGQPQASSVEGQAQRRARRPRRWRGVRAG
jgi:ATP-dependent RNA helicase RhlE